jgi:DGQHR domain-containing protein
MVSESWIVRPAIAVTRNIPKPFYAFSLSASELREITYVSERTKNNPREGIERNLSQSRCKKIGKYIQSEMAVFPNSIIVALEDTARFEPDRTGGSGTIYIPRKPSQALILDGQHRLYGFDFAGGKDMELLVVAFIDISIDLKAHIFRMINGEQKPVNRSLLYDLLELDTSTAAFEDERAHALVKELDRDEESPFYQSIQMTDKREEGFVSQASLITYLKPHLRKGGLFQEEEYSSFNRQFTLLCDYFNAVSDTFPSDWGNADSILSKTAGINAFFRLMGDLVPLIERDGKQPNYEEFRTKLEALNEFPMDVETHRLYGTGGAIAFHKLLKKQLGLPTEE